MPETGFSELTDKFYMKEKIQKLINKIKEIFSLLISKIKGLFAKKSGKDKMVHNGTVSIDDLDLEADEAFLQADPAAPAEEPGEDVKVSKKEPSGFMLRLKNAFIKTVRAIILSYRKVKKFFKKLKRIYHQKKLPILITTLAVLIVILVFVLLIGPQEEEVTITKYQEWMKQLRSKDIVVCQVDTINDFFDEYYEALSEGDTTTLESLYDDPLSANITTELSSIVESYSDLTVYVTPGINSGEVAVFVHYYINFVNIESATPAVDSFYIMMDTELNSVYILTSMYTDADINTFLYLASYRNPIRDLLSDTEDELNVILEEDSELRNIYIIMNAMAEEDSDDETETVSESEEETSEEETQSDTQ